MLLLQENGIFWPEYGPLHRQYVTYCMYSPVYLGSLKGTTESDKRTMETIYVTSPDGYQIVIDKSDWIRFSDNEKPIRRQAVSISDIVVRPIWNSEESLRHRKFMGYEIRFESGTKIFIKLRVQGSIFRKSGHI